MAASGKFLARVEGNDDDEIDGQQKKHVKGDIEMQIDDALTEKIAQLRKSLAADGQQIMRPTVHIGIGRPTTAAAFSQTAAQTHIA
ncbi:hypothetical protein [Cronobacter malonaticus]|uniref:hypothetical protein n=1 Tax=Cronobacter malonaticus TaxID=413503 RepID=UPI001E5FB819|nr:hypothetical protein [Cronobacter malonaticus]MDI9326554.1 hypothetical protein [Cronobacter malonaticus]MDI9361247.1 hypothetical protein [Cronobacter malonaticus]